MSAFLSLSVVDVMSTELITVSAAATLAKLRALFMVHRPGAYELIVGAVTDRQFGPVVLVGHGGTAVELLDDKTLGLPPLNMRLARELVSRTRIDRLLAGFRDRPASNLDAIAPTLIRTAQLVIDFAEIVEFEVNPLPADDYGVMALVLTHHGVPGKTPIYGVVRIGADPDNEEGGYAIIVDREMTGLGLGIVLMRRILDYARNRGIKRIVGDVLRENTTMLKLCEAFGFSKSAAEDSPEIVRVSKTFES